MPGGSFCWQAFHISYDCPIELHFNNHLFRRAQMKSKKSILLAALALFILAAAFAFFTPGAGQNRKQRRQMGNSPLR